MREYRGKRIDNGEWVYGSLVKLENYESDPVGEKFFDVTKYYIQEHAHYDYAIDYLHEVDLTTVGQYTGLKDKNGKEIYEGDILKITCNFELRKDVVIDTVKMWNCSFACNDWLFYELIDNGVKGKQEWEIIGSIHDNPELLEAK